MVITGTSSQAELLRNDHPLSVVAPQTDVSEIRVVYTGRPYNRENRDQNLAESPWRCTKRNRLESTIILESLQRSHWVLNFKFRTRSGFRVGRLDLPWLLGLGAHSVNGALIFIFAPLTLPDVNDVICKGC